MASTQGRGLQWVTRYLLFFGSFLLVLANFHFCRGAGHWPIGHWHWPKISLERGEGGGLNFEATFVAR